ncbi:hypothetical protein H6F51_10445 [Cyanobacteria bacterium FACHB-DQ100]|nr:hypothetical protein [Cyanobacteria bacterium FACHB-DQ100]
MESRPRFILEPAAVVGQFLMQIFTSEAIDRCPSFQTALPSVLGTPLVLNLEEFPELDWLPDYLIALTSLQQERDRLTGAIQAVMIAGDINRDGWIETYTKSKNGKQYTYYQLRWLTGDRKKSGQPKVKTKHLCRGAVGEVRAAIVRGQQIKALEQERQQVENQIFRLKQLVRGTSRRLDRVVSQNSLTHHRPMQGAGYEP